MRAALYYWNGKTTSIHSHIQTWQRSAVMEEQSRHFFQICTLERWDSEAQTSISTKFENEKVTRSSAFHLGVSFECGQQII